MDLAERQIPPSTALRPARTRIEVWLDTALTRGGVTGEFGRDVVLAGFWAVFSVAVLIPLLGPFAATFDLRFTAVEQAVVLGIVGFQALLLCLRRVSPVLCLVLVAACQLGLVAVLPPDASARVAAPIVAAYTAGAALKSDRLAKAVGAAVLLEVIGGAVVAATIAPGVRSLIGGGAFVFQPVEPSLSTIAGQALDDLFVLLLYVTSALIGLFVSLRRAQLREVEARAAEEIAAQLARADAAIREERSRMARELHDIAAHHLSGLVVQASAVERLIDRDPAAAKEATRSIREQGKETLANLRMAVGVLRERLPDGRMPRPANAIGDNASGEWSGEGAPVPGLSVLDLLIDSAKERGDRIEYSATGSPFELPPIADVTAYRVAQEALANARHHAPGAAVKVTLDYGDDRLVLRVSNGPGAGVSGKAADRGFGLIGMRERADLAGASLAAGRSSSGGWQVTLSIPRPDVAASAPASPGAAQ